jgi:hypothetical protein
MAAEDSMTTEESRLGPVDIEAIRLTARLSVGRRVRRLLDTRALLFSIIRTRLHHQYPDLAARDLNLKVLEEIERIERSHTRPHSVS